jgi:deferrochelatase/peroxidase EfeB
MVKKISSDNDLTIAAGNPTARPSGCPFMGRREMLLGLGKAGGAAVVGGLIGRAGLPNASAQNAPVAGPDDELHAIVPSHGVHQAGVVTPRPQFATVVAFDLLASNRGDLQRLFQALTERIQFLIRGGSAATADPKFPPPESGLLGPVVLPGRLTMTVGLGASLFDQRFGLAGQKPRHLKRMPSFPNDALDIDQSHGDLAIQICSESENVNVHALRDTIKNTPSWLSVRWKLDGFLPAESQRKGTERNLLGFKDGTANPSPTDASLMDRQVWVQKGLGEPDWATGGSYQVVRIIRNFVERWDRTPLQEQEAIIGRDKASGAPLGMTNEADIPDYAKDPEGKTMPLDAHIRLANPRTPETAGSVILRRPFNYSRGVTCAGQLDMGLLFVCFQSDLEKGFIAVQQRLNGESLEEYIKPIGGGFFYVLPGVPSEAGYLSEGLFATS